MLTDALRRVSRSPLYQLGRTYDVFLSGTPGMYALLTGGAKGRGRTNFWGNVFIRPADVTSGRVFDSVRARGGEYTLAYYVAHEVTHAMEAAHRGLRLFPRPSAFQWEGYSDYVGLCATRSIWRSGRVALRRDAPEMDVGRTGLYRRYELLVAYLLDHQGSDGRRAALEADGSKRGLATARRRPDALTSGRTRDRISRPLFGQR